MEEITDVSQPLPDDNGGADVETSVFAPEYANNPSIQKFGGDPNKLANSYLQLQSLMGQGRVVIPKDADDVDAWANYDKAFGVPEVAEGYEIDAPDGVDMAEFNALMKENHITKSQAQNIWNKLVEDMASSQAQAQADYDKAVAEQDAILHKEWGYKYKDNIQSADNLLHKITANEAEYNEMNQLLGNNATALKLLVRLSEATSEGSLKGFDSQVRSFAKTPAEARRELAQILQNPNDIYFTGVGANRRNDVRWCKENNQQWVSEEERKARVDYVNSLMEMAG